MKILRTPDSCFEGLKDYPFEPQYTTIKTHDGQDLRIHHIDEGPRDGPVVLCIHGQPVWSYLYRKMIPYLTGAGLRVICPDLVGYGKSDKPAAREDYTYERQVEWMGAWLEQNDFSGLTFFGQDWGGLIGLRLVAAHANRFDNVVIANTGLPYNPDVPQAMIDEVEDYRANEPTPTLFSMTKEMRSLSWGGKGEQPRAHLRGLAEVLLGNRASSDRPDAIDDDRATTNIYENRESATSQAGYASTAALTGRKGVRCALPKRRVHDGTPRHAQSGAIVAHIALARATAAGMGVFR